MANLSIGSSGEEVKKLQNALISAGYNVGSTGADGVFGKNTDAAVRQYQRDNQLAEDGIAGQNTLGKLYAPSNASATEGGNTAANAVVTQPQKIGLDTEIQQKIQQLLDAAPTSFADPYADKKNGYLDQLESRDPFSYNVNSDPLYEQLRDQYVKQGQLASMDVMGQAAAMTGGYGNSYAQTVGQQAYNQYLGQLNEAVPELYGMAYDRYQHEGQDLREKYELYKGLSDQEYAKHQDNVDNWYRQLSMLTGERDAARTEMAGAKSDLINLIAATGYKPTDAELQAAGMTREQANSYATAYSSSLAAESSKNKPKEQTASQDDKDRVLARIAKCEDAEDLDKEAAALIAEGWSEEWVKIYISARDNEIIKEQNKKRTEENDRKIWEGVKAQTLGPNWNPVPTNVDNKPFITPAWKVLG